MHPLQNGSQDTNRPPKKPLTGQPGWFTESGDNNVPSYPGADWFNHVIAEFQNMLASQGIAFDPENDDHLSKAFLFLSERRDKSSLTSFENITAMISGDSHGYQIEHRIGQEYQTGGTIWRVINIPVSNINDFLPLTPISIQAFGADQSLPPSSNKLALQEAISYLDFKSGVLIVPATINYGYIRAQRETWPDFSALSSDPATRIIIEDYSFGQTDNPETPPNRSGAQFRRWYFTGNETDGQHNGNFEYVKANWHPGHFISNDGEISEMAAGAGANRRASTFYATKGIANWRVGQGRITDNNARESELAQFIIAANGFEDLGLEGLTTSLVINKTDGSMGFNVGQPRYPFDFQSRPGQPLSNVFGFETLEGECVLRLAGETGETRINSKPTSGFSITDRDGALYDAAANGAIHTLKRNTAGNVTLKLETVTSSRNITIRDDNGTFNISDPTGMSNDIVIGPEFITKLVIRPESDSTTDIGTASRRFDDIYAVGTVTPSDANLKQDIKPISNAECLAALELELVKFKFNSSVTAKGDSARYHYGVIAQDAAVVLEKHGIDINEFAPLCVTQTKDPDTNKAGEVWQVRYTELQVLISEALKRKVSGMIS